MKGEIDKNKDSLKLLNNYKDFILKLSKEEFKKARDDRQAKLLEKAKMNWIRDVRDRTNQKQDYIIGLAPHGYDKEIHEDLELTKGMD